MYDHIVTFIEQYELEHVRCSNVAMQNGFVCMKSLEDEEITIDGVKTEAYTFMVNSRYVKDIGIVEEGDVGVIGVDVEVSDQHDL